MTLWWLPFLLLRWKSSVQAWQSSLEIFLSIVLINLMILKFSNYLDCIFYFFFSSKAQLLENTHLIVGTAVQANGICEVLYAAAWIVGEFPQHLLNPRHTLDAMFHGRITSLPGHIQVGVVRAVTPLLISILDS